MNLKRLILAVLLPIIAGCASHAPAPVESRRGGGGSPPATAVQTAPVAVGASDSGAGYYTVKKGDTLYSIALDQGQDYKDLVVWNNLDNPGVIKIGQQLRVTPPGGVASGAVVVMPVISSAPVEIKSVAGPVSQSGDGLKRAPKGGKLVYSEEALAKARQGDAAPKPVEPKPEVRAVEAKPAEPPPPGGDEVAWIWPANGKLIVTEAGGKGIDIAGKAGDPVLAAAGGVVSYAGAGLRGYGNLVVLRHNATYLSVYAHNSKILVKEKQSVAKGQKIAEMGSTDAESPRLHFEIRRQGKPVDPSKYLPPR
jgi:lipoprotein NlpD